MTTLFYKAWILQGEIWCWSLLGLKGLILLYFPKVPLKQEQESWDMNFIDLSSNRSGKRYYELILCAQHFSKVLMSTFVLVWVGQFHGFLIVPSWEFHGPLELSSPMKYMLRAVTAFSGVMKCIGLKYMRLSWPMKIHIHGFVNFSWFMKNYNW